MAKAGFRLALLATLLALVVVFSVVEMVVL